MLISGERHEMKIVLTMCVLITVAALIGPAVNKNQVDLSSAVTTQDPKPRAKTRSKTDITANMSIYEISIGSNTYIVVNSINGVAITQVR